MGGFCDECSLEIRFCECYPENIKKKPKKKKSQKPFLTKEIYEGLGFGVPERSEGWPFHH